MIAVDLTGAPIDAGVRLLEPVCRKVGYLVPGYMAAAVRRDLKVSWGKLERLFADLSIRHNIDDVANGTDQPCGQLIVVFWPVEHQGTAAFEPRLYELPWITPSSNSRLVARELSRMIN